MNPFEDLPQPTLYFRWFKRLVRLHTETILQQKWLVHIKKDGRTFVRPEWRDVHTEEEGEN